MDIKSLVKQQIERAKKVLPNREIALGEILFNNNDCQVLSQSGVTFELIIMHPDGTLIEITLHVTESEIIPEQNGERAGWEHNSYASLLQVENELGLLDPKEPVEHKKYSRAGMVRRVMLERRQKADKANYHIKWASNIYGDHTLTNERGVKYKIFLRNFDNETGYSDSMDSRLNKLGTTKHIMYAFAKLKGDNTLFQSLDKTYPFIEVFCDPLNEYRISWYYPHTMPVDEQILILQYFKKSKSIDSSAHKNFLGFIKESDAYPLIRIRPEVHEKVEAAFEEEILSRLRIEHLVDHSCIKTELYPYQKEGIEFALFRKTALIADEMGLGKTLQAIGTAIQKKEIFGFTKTLVVCPASLKEQWKKEIEKFSDEKAIVVAGFPSERFHTSIAFLIR